MWLLSKKSEIEMFAEVVYIDMTQSKDKYLSFTLENPIKTSFIVGCEDRKRQLAVFFTYEYEDNVSGVTLLKMVVDADDKLSQKHVTIALPEKQVNVNVFCIYSDKEDSIDLYCLY